MMRDDRIEVVGDTSDAPVDSGVLIDSTQALNEAVANIPSEVEVCGKKIGVASRSIKDRVLIDREIISLQKLQLKMYPQNLSDATDSDDLLDKMGDAQEAFWVQSSKVILLIANSPQTPKESWLTEEEVMGAGVDELDALVAAYADRNDASKFLKNLSRARSF